MAGNMDIKPIVTGAVTFVNRETANAMKSITEGPC